ncbi:MAG: hypothetical protein AAF503_13725 [Pseudomonadota bacterium]
MSNDYDSTSNGTFKDPCGLIEGAAKLDHDPTALMPTRRSPKNLLADPRDGEPAALVSCKG